MAQRCRSFVSDATESHSLTNSRVFSGLSVDPRQPVTRLRATHARTIDTDARRAVLQFLGVMSDEVGACILPFQTWSASYADLRSKEGWPPLKDKVLALGLQHAGCRRKRMDERSAGRGRYIAYELTMELAA